MSLNAGRLPIFYINIAARADRRAFMEDQFQALGLQAERVAAVLPPEVPPELAARGRPILGDRRLSPAEFACNLSHQMVWREIVGRQLPAALILEDDGVLSSDLPEFIDHLGSKLPSGVDVLKLETFLGNIRLSRKQVLRVGRFTARRLGSTHYGCCGYIISDRAAQWLLSARTLNDLTVDAYLFGRHGPGLYRFQIYQVVPALTIQLSKSEQRQSSVAASDLTPGRKAFPPMHKTYPLRGVLRFPMHTFGSLRELVYFGSEPQMLWGSRQVVPFTS